MFYNILRRILFKLEPEFAHKISLEILNNLNSLGLLKKKIILVKLIAWV